MRSAPVVMWAGWLKQKKGNDVSRFPFLLCVQSLSVEADDTRRLPLRCVSASQRQRSSPRYTLSDAGIVVTDRYGRAG
jgi:hypothetical protein